MNNKLNVLYEDNHVIAVVKPAGMLVQGDYTGNRTLLDHVKKYLKDKYKKPGDVFLGLVHRLDRPVGGVIVFARTSKAAKRLQTQFENHSTEKIYLAWIEGIAEQKGCLCHKIMRNEKRAIISEEGKEARLSYRRLKILENRSFMEILLETGRHHQIRLQFTTIGHPVVGDSYYNSHQRWLNGAIALWSFQLKINHPVTGTRLIFTALPDAWHLSPDLLKEIIFS